MVAVVWCIIESLSVTGVYFVCHFLSVNTIKLGLGSASFVILYTLADHSWYWELTFASHFSAHYVHVVGSKYREKLRKHA